MTLLCMALTWTPSAAKHGIAREDALHAILNYQYRVREFDEPRAGSSGRPDLFIGKARDGSTLLEIMAVITPPDGFVIFHVMKAREKILNIAEKGGKS